MSTITRSFPPYRANVPMMPANGPWTTITLSPFLKRVPVVTVLSPLTIIFNESMVSEGTEIGPSLLPMKRTTPTVFTISRCSTGARLVFTNRYPGKSGNLIITFRSRRLLLTLTLGRKTSMDFLSRPSLTTFSNLLFVCRTYHEYSSSDSVILSVVSSFASLIFSNVNNV